MGNTASPNHPTIMHQSLGLHFSSLLFLLFALSIPGYTADPAPATQQEIRSWELSNGKTMQAAVIRLQGSSVLMRSESGNEKAFPLSGFSPRALNDIRQSAKAAAALESKDLEELIKIWIPKGRAGVYTTMTHEVCDIVFFKPSGNAMIFPKGQAMSGVQPIQIGLYVTYKEEGKPARRQHPATEAVPSSTTPEHLVFQSDLRDGGVVELHYRIRGNRIYSWYLMRDAPSGKTVSHLQAISFKRMVTYEDNVYESPGGQRWTSREQLEQDLGRVGVQLNFTDTEAGEMFPYKKPIASFSRKRPVSALVGGGILAPRVVHVEWPKPTEMRNSAWIYQGYAPYQGFSFRASHPNGQSEHDFKQAFYIQIR